MISITAQNPIIAVRPYHDSFVIHWLMGRRCNFDCSYCPEMYHDRQAQDPELPRLQEAWQRMVDGARGQGKSQISLSLLGGELTIIPAFMPFMRWLHEHYADMMAELGLVTNGTASAKIYQELARYCTWLTFSTHSEFMSEQRFFRNVIAARDANADCLVTVNIMDEPWHRSRNLEYERFLDRHGIKHYRHPILDFDDRKQARPARTYQKIDFHAHTKENI